LGLLDGLIFHLLMLLDGIIFHPPMLLDPLHNPFRTLPDGTVSLIPTL
jgi:hypothetical protein